MGGSSRGLCTPLSRARTTAAPSVLTCSSGLCSTVMLALCVFCCCSWSGVHSCSNARVVTTSVLTNAAASTCSRGAFCTAVGLRQGRRAWRSWRRRAMLTATGRAEIEERRGGAARGVSMKASKKNKRRPQLEDDGTSPRPKPQRVTSDAPVSVRTQIQYVKMKKSLEKSKNSKKTINNKYRRLKSTDYEDIVEPEDLSHVYMPSIAPALMVDGYNIIFHWSKCCIMADNGDLEGARQLLVEELDTLSAMRGWTVTVVFDADRRAGGGKRNYFTPNKIEVVFTSNGESADMYVERLTMELKDAGCPNVMVATGDKLMQSLVVGAGAEVFSPDRIIEEIEISHQEAVAFADMYLRRKQSVLEKSEMQDLLDRVRTAEETAKRKRTGGRGGRDSNRPSFNIEDDL